MKAGIMKTTSILVNWQIFRNFGNDPDVRCRDGEQLTFQFFVRRLCFWAIRFAARSALRSARLAGFTFARRV